MSSGHTASGASRPDLLDMAYINSLPPPFFVREFGDKDFMWPVNDIDVATGLYRIDVCGKLQACHISNAAEFRDADGVIHDSADFYIDSERAQRNKSDETEVCETCKGRRFYTRHFPGNEGTPEWDADDQNCPDCNPNGEGIAP